MGQKVRIKLQPDEISQVVTLLMNNSTHITLG